MKVTFFDKKNVRQALEQWVEELAGKHPEVERILLFGSLASGIPVPGSDVDLLIILKGSVLPFRDRIPGFLPSGFPVGVDVFPYTQEEVGNMLKEGNHFISSIFREGVELFRRKAN